MKASSGASRHPIARMLDTKLFTTWPKPFLLASDREPALPAMVKSSSRCTEASAPCRVTPVSYYWRAGLNKLDSLANPHVRTKLYVNVLMPYTAGYTAAGMTWGRIAHLKLSISGFLECLVYIRRLMETLEEDSEDDTVACPRRKYVPFRFCWHPASSWCCGGHWATGNIRVK